MSSKRVVLLLDDIYTARAKYVHELAYIVSSYAKSLGANIDFEDDFRFHDVAVAYKTLSLLKETKLQIALRSCLKNVAMLLSIPTLDIELTELNELITKYTQKLEFEVNELGGFMRKESGINLDDERIPTENSDHGNNNIENKKGKVNNNDNNNNNNDDDEKKKLKKKMKKEKRRKEDKDSSSPMTTTTKISKAPVVQKKKEKKKVGKKVQEEEKKEDIIKTSPNIPSTSIETGNTIIQDKGIIPIEPNITKETSESTSTSSTTPSHEQTSSTTTTTTIPPPPPPPDDNDINRIILSKTPKELWDEYYPEMNRFIEIVYKPIIESSPDRFKSTISSNQFYKVCGKNINKNKPINKVYIDVKDVKNLFKTNHVEYLSKAHLRKALKAIEHGEFKVLGENIEKVILTSVRNNDEEGTSSSSSSSSSSRSSSQKRSSSLNRPIITKYNSSPLTSPNPRAFGTNRASSTSAAVGTPSSRSRSQGRSSSMSRGSPRTSSGVRKSEGGFLSYELWNAASQKMKGIPPPLEGLSSKEQLALRKKANN